MARFLRLAVRAFTVFCRAGECTMNTAVSCFTHVEAPKSNEGLGGKSYNVFTKRKFSRICLYCLGSMGSSLIHPCGWDTCLSWCNGRSRSYKCSGAPSLTRARQWDAWCNFTCALLQLRRSNILLVHDPEHRGVLSPKKSARFKPQRFESGSIKKLPLCLVSTQTYPTRAMLCTFCWWVRSACGSEPSRKHHIECLYL